MGEFEHYVYVMATRSAGGGIQAPIKIGVTRDPDKRLSSIRTSCPNPICFAFVLNVFDPECARDLERAAHDFFAEHATNGEWFSVGPTRAAEFLTRYYECKVLSVVGDDGGTIEAAKVMLEHAGVGAVKRKIAADRYVRAWEMQVA